VTPFLSPMAAMHRRPEGKDEPVAIIAIDGEEYLAIDTEGTTVVGPWAEFNVVDSGVLSEASRALHGFGS
jgi:hypothetical protein